MINMLIGVPIGLVLLVIFIVFPIKILDAMYPLPKDEDGFAR